MRSDQEGPAKRARCAPTGGASCASDEPVGIKPTPRFISGTWNARTPARLDGSPFRAVVRIPMVEPEAVAVQNQLFPGAVRFVHSPAARAHYGVEHPSELLSFRHGYSLSQGWSGDSGGDS